MTVDKHPPIKVTTSTQWVPQDQLQLPVDQRSTNWGDYLLGVATGVALMVVLRVCGVWH